MLTTPKYKAARDAYQAAARELRDARNVHEEEGTDETALLLTMAREEFARAGNHFEKEQTKLMWGSNMVTFS